MVTDDDEDDFREAMQDVAPLKKGRSVADATAKPAEPTIGQLRRRDGAEGKTDTPKEDPNYLTLGEVPPVDPRQLLEWKKDGVQRQVFSKLKQGRYDLQGELDLHRHTVKEAREAVYKFVALAQAKDWRAVRITHGRGEFSPTPARLKSYVNAWLRCMPEVIAFHSALRNQGGSGSLYVLLRKSANQKEFNREVHGFKGSDTQ